MKRLFKALKVASFMNEKVKLNYKVEEIVTIQDNDFSDFVSAYYGHDFKFMADHEATNDSSYSFKITKNDKNPVEVFRNMEKEKMDKFKKTGEGRFMTNSILQDMVDNDILPEGKIVIEVSY